MGVRLFPPVADLNDAVRAWHFQVNIRFPCSLAADQILGRSPDVAWIRSGEKAAAVGAVVMEEEQCCSPEIKYIKVIKGVTFHEGQ